MSLADVESPIPAISEPPEIQPPHIIDVDSLDAEDIVHIGSSPPRQRRRVGEDGRSIPVQEDVILIHDSDDEVQYVGSSQGIRRRSGQRERIFSPPPPPQAGGIPPVPPIPPRFASGRRRLSFPAVGGPIIPNDVPFPFEVDIRAQHNLAHNGQAQNTLPAAPPSHHTPSMGFGGALLAGVRHVFNPRGNGEHGHRRRAWGIQAPFFVRWDTLDVLRDGFQWDYFDGDFEDNGEHIGGVRQELEREFDRRSKRHENEPDYKPEYTHPNKPSPGFTYDFSTTPTVSTDPIVVWDDSPGSSSSGSSRSSEATLACAQCHDHLTLGASDVGEDRDQRRLWGLRCGHLLDGKCVSKLMQPAAAVTEDTLKSSSYVDVKGKGKMDPASQDMLPSNSANISEGAVGVNPIRSRLRSHRGTARPPAGSLDSLPRDPCTQPASGVSRRSRAGARGKGKGKGKASAPIITAEHEWVCPVSGCGRIHVSVLIGGRWVMDEKRGAIAVFV
ncbi:hypothetical protein ID866_3909 [Astraeus odoratus]|nr:hypothetical protein ID866_3909 [Astraeus odoratus]